MHNINEYSLYVLKMCFMVSTVLFVNVSLPIKGGLFVFKHCFIFLFFLISHSGDILFYKCINKENRIRRKEWKKVDRFHP